jgi:hypothetical protein
MPTKKRQSKKQKSSTSTNIFQDSPTVDGAMKVMSELVTKIVEQNNLGIEEFNKNRNAWMQKHSETLKKYISESWFSGLEQMRNEEKNFSVNSYDDLIKWLESINVSATDAFKVLSTFTNRNKWLHFRILKDDQHCIWAVDEFLNGVDALIKDMGNATKAIEHIYNDSELLNNLCRATGYEKPKGNDISGKSVAGVSLKRFRDDITAMRKALGINRKRDKNFDYSK